MEGALPISQTFSAKSKSSLFKRVTRVTNEITKKSIQAKRFKRAPFSTGSHKWKKMNLH